MPPRGYRSVSIREEVYRKLEALAREIGLSSVPDAVAFLLKAYSESRGVVEMLRRVEERLGRIEAELREVMSSRVTALALLLMVVSLPWAVAPLTGYYPNYADAYGQRLPPELVDYVLRVSRMPEDRLSLGEYREFARRFYAECEVKVDMALLLLYGVEDAVKSSGVWYYPFFAVVYDPLTGRVLRAFLNRSALFSVVTWGNSTVNAYVWGMRPIGYQMWLVEVDEEAFARGSLVVLVYYFRWNETHIHNPYVLYNNRPLRPYCPLPEGFDYRLYFRGLHETVTVTQAVTVTETYTPPPATVTVTRTTTAYRTTTETVTATTYYTVTETLTLPPTTVTEVMTLPPETVTETRVETVAEVVTETSTVEVYRTVPPVTVTLTPEVRPAVLDWSVAVAVALFAGVAVGLALGRRR